MQKKNLNIHTNQEEPKHCQKWSKILKNQDFFFHLKILYFFLAEKNAIILVLPVEEISLRPELSAPPRFRFQGGGSLNKYFFYYLFIMHLMERFV